MERGQGWRTRKGTEPAPMETDSPLPSGRFGNGPAIVTVLATPAA